MIDLVMCHKEDTTLVDPQFRLDQKVFWSCHRFGQAMLKKFCNKSAQKNPAGYFLLSLHLNKSGWTF